MPIPKAIVAATTCFDYLVIEDKKICIKIESA